MKASEFIKEAKKPIFTDKQKDDKEVNETKLTNADFQNDIAKVKAGKADPSVMANKWGSRGGAFLNFIKSKDKNEGEEVDETTLEELNRLRELSGLPQEQVNEYPDDEPAKRSRYSYSAEDAAEVLSRIRGGEPLESLYPEYHPWLEYLYQRVIHSYGLDADDSEQIHDLLVDWLRDESGETFKGDEFDEQSPAANAKALMGSGRGPTGTNPKGRGDSPEHRAVRTPGTTYSKRPNQKKYGKPGANDGFIGG